MTSTTPSSSPTDMNLQSYLKNRNDILCERDKIVLSYDICRGVRDIHNHGRSHGCLTPYNIVMVTCHGDKVTGDDDDGDGYDVGLVRASIRDFGHSNENRLLASLCDDHATYEAPETHIILHNTAMMDVSMADIYSLGMIIYRIWLGAEPVYHDHDGLFIPVITRHDNDLYPHVVKMIQSCCYRDPPKRPSIHDVFNFFQALVPEEHKIPDLPKHNHNNDTMMEFLLPRLGSSSLLHLHGLGLEQRKTLLSIQLCRQLISVHPHRRHHHHDDHISSALPRPSRTLVSLLQAHDPYMKTEAYRAPETHGTQLVNNYEADIYTLGMVLYRLWTGHEPFESVDPAIIPTLAVNGQRPSLPLDFDFEGLKSIIQRCWDADPAARPSLEEVYDFLQVVLSSYDHLGVAVSIGYTSVVREILQHGTNIDVNGDCKDYQCPPLIIAAAKGHHSIVHELILHGANVHIARSNGATALYIAAQNGFADVARELLQQNAYVNAACLPSHGGITPLIAASSLGHTEVVRVLLHHNANPNLAALTLHDHDNNNNNNGNVNDDNDGSTNNYNNNMINGGGGVTPIFVASAGGHLATVRELLARGALIDTVIQNHNDGDSKDHDDDTTSSSSTSTSTSTSLTIAMQNGHEDVVRELQRHVNRNSLYTFIHHQQLPSTSSSSSSSCSEKLLTLMSIDLCRGVMGLHRNNSVHGSLTPHKLSVLSQSLDPNVQHLKIDAISSSTIMVENNNNSVHMVGQGRSLSYIAPEMHNIRKVNPNKAMDIYSVGMILYFMWTGIDPFGDVEDEGEIPDLVRDGRRPSFTPSFRSSSSSSSLSPSSSTSSSSFDFSRLQVMIQRCWDADPEKRPQIEIIKRFFEDILSAYDNVGLAVLMGCSFIVRDMLARGDDLNMPCNDRADTPLYIAALNGHVGIVRLLLQYGDNGKDRRLPVININIARNNGTTPLYVASQNGHDDVVNELLHKHANVNGARNDNTTSLYIASQNGHVDVVCRLLRYNADVNIARNDGATPLYVACQKGHLDIVRGLIAHHANINAAYKGVFTPLYVAAENGHEFVVRELLKHHPGISPSSPSPLSIANHKKHKKIVAIMMGYLKTRKSHTIMNPAGSAKRSNKDNDSLLPDHPPYDTVVRSGMVKAASSSDLISITARKEDDDNDKASSSSSSLSSSPSSSSIISPLHSSEPQITKARSFSSSFAIDVSSSPLSSSSTSLSSTLPSSSSIPWSSEAFLIPNSSSPLSIPSSSLSPSTSSSVPLSFSSSLLPLAPSSSSPPQPYEANEQGGPSTALTSSLSSSVSIHPSSLLSSSLSSWSLLQSSSSSTSSSPSSSSTSSADKSIPNLIPSYKIEFKFDSEIGRGSYGSVYKGSYTGVAVALKELHTSNDNEVIKEAALLNNLRHPKIISYFGVSRGPNGNLFLVTEYFRSDSLAKMLKAQLSSSPGISSFTNLDILFIAREVAAGMLYLQEHQVLHRDLAARNVLIAHTTDGKSGNRKWNIKIIDFGMGKLQDPEQSHYSASTNTQSLSTRWCAIETLQSLRFSCKSDVWAFGVLLWEMLHPGKLPYGALQTNKIGEFLASGYRMPITRHDAPTRLVEIISSCWKEDPATRPDFRQLYDELKFLYTSMKSERTSLSHPVEPSITTNSSASKPASGAGARSWDVEQVSRWMITLGLSRDYADLIREHHITGRVLMSMKKGEDWRETGITTFGDIKILCDEVLQLAQSY